MHCCLDVMYYRSFELKDGDSICQTKASWYTDGSVNRTPLSQSVQLLKCAGRLGGGEVYIRLRSADR